MPEHTFKTKPARSPSVASSPSIAGAISDHRLPDKIRMPINRWKEGTDPQPVQLNKDEAAKRRQQMDQTLYDARAMHHTRTQDYRSTATFAGTLRQDEPTKDIKYLDEIRKRRKSGKVTPSDSIAPRKDQPENHVVGENKEAEKKEEFDEFSFWDLFDTTKDKGKSNTEDRSHQPEALKKIEYTKDESLPDPSNLAKIKQLHVFINIPGTPANRVVVFFEHMRGRTQPAIGQKLIKGSAVSIQQGKDEGLEVVDLSSTVDGKLKAAPAEDKLQKASGGGSTKSPTVEKDRSDKMSDLLQNGMKKYKATLDKFVMDMKESHENDASERKYDEMVVIGVAHPGKKTKDGEYYDSYNNISGLRNIEEITRTLNLLANKCLKDDGTIRVQLCHAGSVGKAESKSFIEQIMPAQEASDRRITISAPKSFSIIGSNGGVIDVTTYPNIFDQCLKGELAALMKDKEFKKAPINEKNELVQKKLKELEKPYSDAHYYEPDQIRRGDST